MANYKIPLSYVVTTTVSSGGVGLEAKKLSTLLILTNEEQVEAYSGGYMIARTASSVLNTYGTDSIIGKMAQAIFSQNPNILNNNGYVICANYQSEETTAAALNRLSQQIYFEGVLLAKDIEAAEAKLASNAVEAMDDTILFLTSNSTSDLQENGLFYDLKGNSKTRKLLYLKGSSDTEKKLNAKLFASAFASRGLSVNYQASNSTLTMTYKDLAGVECDTNISETILATCETVGADVYCSLEGLAKVISFKQGGLYFDELTNNIWLRSTIQTDIANVLFTTRGKIPQTTQGVNTLCNAIATVLKQGVRNGMLAPREWTSADTFGNLEDFHRCIRTDGYYIYFIPIAEQSATERKARKCPAISIACKAAGAIEHANIIIYVES